MNRLYRAVLILAVFAVTACETPLQRRTFPDMTFTHLPPIALDVATIEVVRLFEPNLKSPHVEHEMPVAPLKAVERWVEDRLRAAGTGGHAKVTIRDASVVEARLKSAGGIKSAFTAEQAERYDAKISVEIEAVGDRGLRAANAIATSTRSRTISEDATLRERESLWFELTEKLMQDFDRTFEAQIREHLTAFLK
jgi:hypothetical protein